MTVHKLPAFSKALLLGVIVFVAIFGVFDCMNRLVHAQMNMGQSSATTDCLPMGRGCKMDISQHLTAWQHTFAANFNSDFLNALATLLVLSFALAIFRTASFPAISLLAVRYLNYDRHHPDSRLYNYFLRIFSTGILQPKLFA